VEWLRQGAGRRVMRVAGRIGLWLATALATVTLFNAGLGKFASAPGWQHWFVDVWGYPTWFRVLIGLAEAGGALLLLWPRLASYSAAGLIIIMAGAFWTVTTQPTDLSAVDPVVNAALLAIVAFGWWPRRVRQSSLTADAYIDAVDQTTSAAGESADR